MAKIKKRSKSSAFKAIANARAIAKSRAPNIKEVSNRSLGLLVLLLLYGTVSQCKRPKVLA